MERMVIYIRSDALSNQLEDKENSVISKDLVNTRRGALLPSLFIELLICSHLQIHLPMCRLYSMQHSCNLHNWSP